MADAPEVRGIELLLTLGCGVCAGSGEVDHGDGRNPRCRECRGKGRVEELHTVYGLDALAVDAKNKRLAAFRLQRAYRAVRPRSSQQWADAWNAYEEADLAARAANKRLDDALAAALLAEGGKDG